MTPEEAINRLIQRNQAFVNKQGKSTDYSRESDAIVNALLKALRELKKLKENIAKLQQLTDLCDVSAINEALTAVSNDFIDLVWSKRFTEYQDGEGVWHKFSSDPKIYYRQLLEAFPLHQQSVWNLENDIEAEWAFINEAQSHKDWTPEQIEEISALHYQQIKAWEEDKETLAFHD